MRCAAIDTLGKMTPHVDGVASVKHAEVVAGQLMNDASEWTVRCAALKALAQMGPAGAAHAAAVALQLSGNNEWMVTAAAVGALGRMGADRCGARRRCRGSWADGRQLVCAL